MAQTQEPNPSQPLPLPTNLEELDLVKFQLLSSYLGMAKQEGETLASQQELLALKQEANNERVEHATAQLTTFNQYLVAKYQLAKGDQLNYGTGSIQRGTTKNNEDHSGVAHEDQKTPQAQETP